MGRVGKSHRSAPCSPGALGVFGQGLGVLGPGCPAANAGVQGALPDSCPGVAGALQGPGAGVPGAGCPTAAAGVPGPGSPANGAKAKAWLAAALSTEACLNLWRNPCGSRAKSIPPPWRSRAAHIRALTGTGGDSGQPVSCLKHGIRPFPGTANHKHRQGPRSSTPEHPDSINQSAPTSHFQSLIRASSKISRGQAQKKAALRGGESVGALKAVEGEQLLLLRACSEHRIQC